MAGEHPSPTTFSNSALLITLLYIWIDPRHTVFPVPVSPSNCHHNVPSAPHVRDVQKILSDALANPLTPTDPWLPQMGGGAPGPASLTPTAGSWLRLRAGTKKRTGEQVPPSLSQGRVRQLRAGAAHVCARFPADRRLSALTPGRLH